MSRSTMVGGFLCLILFTGAGCKSNPFSPSPRDISAKKGLSLSLQVGRNEVVIDPDQKQSVPFILDVQTNSPTSYHIVKTTEVEPLGKGFIIKDDFPENGYSGEQTASFVFNQTYQSPNQGEYWVKNILRDTVSNKTVEHRLKVTVGTAQSTQPQVNANEPDISDPLACPTVQPKAADPKLVVWDEQSKTNISCDTIIVEFQKEFDCQKRLRALSTIRGEVVRTYPHLGAVVEVQIPKSNCSAENVYAALDLLSKEPAVVHAYANPVAELAN